MKPLKILIIEDELVTAYDLRESLEQAGHEVTGIARNLSKALQLVRTNPPNLALIDIHLDHSPEDGIGIAQQLLERHNMPIIYLTSHSEQQTVARAQQTRPAAYLLKPFRHQELAIQIELAYLNYQATQDTAPDPYISESLYLPIKEGKGHMRVVKNEVLYIKASRSYMEVYSVNASEMQLFTMPLGHIAQFFTTKNFYRVSQSILVNLNHVEQLEKGFFYVRGRKEGVAFAESQYQAFKKQLAIIQTPKNNNGTNRNDTIAPKI